MLCACLSASIINLEPVDNDYRTENTGLPHRGEKGTKEKWHVKCEMKKDVRSSIVKLQRQKSTIGNLKM